MTTKMTVAVLGCDGSYPGPGGACSGYLVRAAGVTLWMDAGPGTLANLQLHAGLADVDAVFLSHEHPDHWTDAEGFAVACKYGELCRDGEQERRVPVYAPGGLRDHFLGPVEVFDWNVVQGGDRVDLGGMQLSFSRTDHGAPGGSETLAVRVDASGSSIGYTADTGPGWSPEALGEGIGLCLCEATFLKDREGSVQHLSGRQAGSFAREAGVGRLVLTHRWPTVPAGLVFEEASEAFGSAVTLAQDRAEYPAEGVQA